MNYVRIIIIILLLVSTCACKNDVQKITKINYIKIENENKNIKTYHGFIKALLSPDLSFQTEGIINYFPYSQGDFIKKGDVIAKLDGTLYKLKKEEELARLKEIKIENDRLQQYYKRMDILHKQGGISDNDWEDAYFSLKTNAEKIKIQKEKIKYIEKEINYNILTAPFDGYVGEKYLQLGSWAGSNVPVLKFISNAQTQAEIMANSEIINEINIGKSVKVKKGNKTYEGKISHYSKNSLNSGGYLVKIYLDKIYSELKDGMSVDIDIDFNNKPAFLIPIDCVLRENEKYYVFKLIEINNNFAKLNKTEITIGEIKNDKIEVLSGIKKDDLIAQSNLENLHDNEEVEI